MALLAKIVLVYISAKPFSKNFIFHSILRWALVLHFNANLDLERCLTAEIYTRNGLPSQGSSRAQIQNSSNNMFFVLTNGTGSCRFRTSCPSEMSDQHFFVPCLKMCPLNLYSTQTVPCPKTCPMKS